MAFGSSRPQAATSSDTANAMGSSARCALRDVVMSSSRFAGANKSLHAEAVHQIVKRGPAHAQQFGGAQHVVVRARKRGDDGAFFGLVAHGAQVEHFFVRVALRAWQRE